MTPNSSLLQWLSTFELDGQTCVELKEDAYYNLADGYVCARLLNQISPQYFSDKWLDGIKPVPPNGSWRLRVSNLKRILQKIHDYASDLQSAQFRPNAINPDVAVIAQNFDPDQISRLIQLILFCAINSDQKQHYISKIHDLPTQVKQDIKEAIEELLVTNNDNQSGRINASQTGNDSVHSENESGLLANSSYRSSSSLNQTNTVSPSRPSIYRGFLRRDSNEVTARRNSALDASTTSTNGGETIEEMRQKLNNALILKDERSQTCHELELKLKQLQLEKDQLAFENERLANERNSVKLLSSPTKSADSRRITRSSRDVELDVTERGRLKAIDDTNSHNLIVEQNRKLQAETSRLRDEMVKLETEKDEFRLRSNLLKEDLDKITSKHDELRNKAELARKLQDELDEHKQISEKVGSYETMIENLVKKNNEMKQKLKSLEDKNMAHIQNIVRLEEQNSQLADQINRIDIYKKQLHETQVKLSQETHRADTAEIELTRVSEKYSASKKENERLYETTNQLIKGGVHSSFATSSSHNKYLEKTLYDEQAVGGDHTTNTEALSASPSSIVELKERLTRLEVENELLQNKLNVKRDKDNTVLSGLLENASARCTKLEIENRQFKKKILMLESRLKDTADLQGGPSTSTGVLAESSSDNVMDLMTRIEELQRLLFQKEQELMDSETKYKRNIQKARDLIKTLNNNQSLSNSLHPSCMSSASSFTSNSLDELNLLRQQLRDREERFIELERDFSEYKRFKEVHERLILSAFYGLTTPMQWKNAEKRLERSTITSPPGTASSSINNSKHGI